MLTVTLLVSIFFGGPAGALFYVHVKNFTSGKTTNERFAKAARSGSINSSERSESQTSILPETDTQVVNLIERPRKRGRKGCFGNC